MRANETYSKARSRFSIPNEDVVTNAQAPHKWWFTVKSSVFGSSLSLPSVVDGGGGLVCESVGED